MLMVLTDNTIDQNHFGDIIRTSLSNSMIFYRAVLWSCIHITSVGMQANISTIAPPPNLHTRIATPELTKDTWHFRCKILYK